MSQRNEESIAATQAEVDEIMKKYDRESAYRTLVGYRGVIISAVLILFSVFQLYSTWRIIPSTHMRPLHLGVVLLLSYLLYPASRKMSKDRLPWYDAVLALVSLAVCLYPVIFFNQIAMQFGYADYQIAIGLVAIILLLEACRRVVGLPIVIIALVFLSVGLFGRYMPGFLGNRGYTVRQLVQYLFYTQEGVFGAPLGASSTFIFLFILFGSFLEKTGVGEFFIDLSNALCGHLRGGPAKVAVITSALEGTVSGSSVANTVGSGSFTIPMMKKLGYKPEFAAAVEAAASTGGQIMPPVMGAAAFLMAESIGLPYAVIVKAAIIPALLYFAGIYIITDLEAKKQGLRGMDRDKMPRLKRVMMDRGYLILPLVAIITILGMGYTPTMAALIGILTAVIGSYLRTLAELVVIAFPGKRSYAFVSGSAEGVVPDTRKKAAAQALRFTRGLKPMDYLRALESGGRSIVGVALACGVAGVIAGMITKTGIGLKMGAGLSGIAGNNLLLLLIFTMFASILLGMGVPTTANYLITSTIMAPIVAKALFSNLSGVYSGLQAMGDGYALLPAHLFTFYFGIIADITPPVALAAMAGAAIAKSDPLKTGINASKLAIAAFLVPYIFVFNPQMLMLNAVWYEVAQIIITSLIGMLGIGMALERFWQVKLNVLQQLLSLVGGLLLIDPGTLTDLCGIALVGTVIVWQYLQVRNAKRKDASASV